MWKKFTLMRICLLAWKGIGWQQPNRNSKKNPKLIRNKVIKKTLPNSSELLYPSLLLKPFDGFWWLSQWLIVGFKMSCQTTLSVFNEGNQAGLVGLSSKTLRPWISSLHFHSKTWWRSGWDGLGKLTSFLLKVLDLFFFVRLSKKAF